MRMTCDDALLLISSQLDGQLSDTEQAQLQTHLEQCAQCRALMEALRLTDIQLRHLEEEPPVDLHHRIMEAVAAELPANGKKRKFRFGTLTAAAMLAVLIGVGSLALPRQQQEPVPAEASVMTARTMIVPQPAAYTPEVQAMTAEEMAAAAQAVADGRGAEVALLLEYLPELGDCLCEPQVDGSMLYTLSDADGARDICRKHSAVLYQPVNTEGNDSVSYALLIEQP